MTIGEWRQRSKARLKQSGAQDWDADVDWMLCEALDLGGRSALRFKVDEALGQPQLDLLEHWLKRRTQGRPLQYVLGNEYFMGLKFFVDERVLIPRPETEQLCQLALSKMDEQSPLNVLDLCTGSGALAVGIAAFRPNARVVGSDFSASALAVAQLNAAENQVGVEFVHSDLFADLQGRSFDLIVTNPPYIKSADLASLQREVRQEPAMALDGGADGFDFYRRIADGLAAHLVPGGFVFAEVGAGQAAQVAAYFGDALGSDANIERDISGIERIGWGKNTRLSPRADD